MAKRRHEEVQEASSKTAMAMMVAGGLAVAALVVWALTRTVQPVPEPSASTVAPVTIEQPPTGTTTIPPLDTVASGTSSPQLAPPAADPNANVARTSVADLRAKLDGNQVTIIDVRDKTSFMGSHIPGSLNVPVQQMESQVAFLPKDKPIVTYCTWPNEESSARAALILERYGFKNVSALKGGYDAWRGAGAPTAQGEPPVIQ